MRSGAAEKIALFRRLFQGRQDVYARRGENRKTGKSGYSPVCALEWSRGLCGKPKGSCATCAHRQFEPVTDAVIEKHLRGIDGSGHFGNLDDCRRDRRKDALLQEQGYFVLRFLAEDVVERLNEVLNTICRRAGLS